MLCWYFLDTGFLFDNNGPCCLTGGLPVTYFAILVHRQQTPWGRSFLFKSHNPHADFHWFPLHPKHFQQSNLAMDQNWSILSYEARMRRWAFPILASFDNHRMIISITCPDPCLMGIVPQPVAQLFFSFGFQPPNPVFLKSHSSEIWSHRP